MRREGKEWEREKRRDRESAEDSVHREGKQKQARGAEVKREIRAERRVPSDGRNRVDGLQA
jgi:hypothetical protein